MSTGAVRRALARQVAVAEGGAGKVVAVVPPPATHDQWPGSTAERVGSHWSKPMPEGERGN
jgi:hypothetical protein